jgi:hypothetical protein
MPPQNHQGGDGPLGDPPGATPERNHDELVRVASDANLSEDAALAMLTRRDLSSRAIEALRRNPALANRRKVLPAIAAHPRTPKHISVALARQMFTFELLRVVQTPGAPADVQRLCEETILGRVESISAGERLTLAKSATGRLAAALLRDTEPRIRDAALNNPRLTEELIVRELMHPTVPRELVDALQVHPKWSLRRDIRDTILRRVEQESERGPDVDDESHGAPDEQE